MPNKKLLKASYILGIAFGIFEICTLFLCVFGIVSIIISFYIKKVSNMKNNEIEKNKDKFFYISILFAIVSPISGVLTLIYYICLERENEKKLKKEHTKK